MKIRFKNPKNPGQEPKKVLAARQKYKRMKLATIILSLSWIVVGGFKYDKEIWQTVQSIIGIFK